MNAPLKPDREDEDSLTAQLLEKIAPVAARSQSAAQNGRAVFMQQAQSIKASLPVPPPQSKPFQPAWLSRKGLFGLNPMVTLLTIAALILGSTTTTVYAAQNSYPGYFLYPVKIASEDLSLSLAASSSDKVGMDIEFANRRLQEATSLAQNEKGIPSSVANRWGQHLNNAFDDSQQLGDSQMGVVLAQVHTGLTSQVQTIEQLLEAHPQDAQLLRLHNEIKASIKLTDIGLSDPPAFRQQVKAAGGNEIEREILSMEGENPGTGPTPAGTEQAGKTATPAASATPTQLSNGNRENEMENNLYLSPTQDKENGGGNQNQSQGSTESQKSDSSHGGTPEKPDSSNQSGGGDD